MLTAGELLTGPPVSNDHSFTPLALFSAYTLPSALPTYTSPIMSKHGDELTNPPVVNSHLDSTIGPGGPANILLPVWRTPCRNCGHGAMSDGDADGVTDGDPLTVRVIVLDSDGDTSPPNPVSRDFDADTLAVTDADALVDAVCD